MISTLGSTRLHNLESVSIYIDDGGTAVLHLCNGRDQQLTDVATNIDEVLKILSYAADVAARANCSFPQLLEHALRPLQVHAERGMKAAKRLLQLADIFSGGLGNIFKSLAQAF